MWNLNEPIARRAILQKSGVTDIQFELHRHRSGFDFAMIENGRNVGVFWRTLTPQQAMCGDAPNLSMDSVWESCVVKRYPGFTASAVEDAFTSDDAV